MPNTNKAQNHTATKRVATPEATAAFMNKVLDRTIRPHADEIAEIADDGDVAIVFHEVIEETQSVRDFLAALRRSERGPVVRLTRSRARALFGAIETQDPTFWSWTTTRREHVRILVIAHGGATLCVNNINGIWGFEPGTLDSEYLN